MPNHLSRLLLALALSAIGFSSAGAVPLAVSGGMTGKLTGGLDSAVALAPPPPPPPPARHASKKRTLGARASAIALQAVGVPYRWGGTSPASGFDCSGLVYWAYGRLGIELPHSSYALYGQGRRVARSRLKKGDLLFFYGLGHVGIYVGRGRMVHAPQSGRRVEVVRLGRSGYGGKLVGARRVVRT
jgi:cell wall-associated NlpC family hydrolase